MYIIIIPSLSPPLYKGGGSYYSRNISKVLHPNLIFHLKYMLIAAIWGVTIGRLPKLSGHFYKRALHNRARWALFEKRLNNLRSLHTIATP